MAGEFQELRSMRLLELAQQGDMGSLDLLLSGYLSYLKLLSLSQFDQRLRGRLTASDLVQESLLEAHRDFSSFAGTSTTEFTGWLRKILIHNAARAVETHLLAARRDSRRERPLDVLRESRNRSHSNLSQILATCRRGPASEAELQDDLTSMAAAIDRLPPKYREVIVLRHLDGLPFGEVANRMQRSTGATRMLWLRAIEKLRSTMSPED